MSQPPQNVVARRCLVSGRVQGVAYRISAAQRARAGRIGGYARNLADGRVEVLACGELRDVEAFIAWLWTGPAAARVIEVSVESIEPDPDTMQLDRFTTA